MTAGSHNISLYWYGSDSGTAAVACVGGGDDDDDDDDNS